MKTSFNLGIETILLFSLLGFCEPAKCQQVLPDDTKLKHIILENIKYPEEARKQGIEGVFYIVVKVSGGKIENLIILDKDEKIKQPFIINISIEDKTIPKKTSLKNYAMKPMTILEDEAVRVAKLFETVNLSEWINQTAEFAILFEFKLADQQ